MFEHQEQKSSKVEPINQGESKPKKGEKDQTMGKDVGPGREYEQVYQQLTNLLGKLKKAITSSFEYFQRLKEDATEKRLDKEKEYKIGRRAFIKKSAETLAMLGFYPLVTSKVFAQQENAGDISKGPVNIRRIKQGDETFTVRLVESFREAGRSIKPLENIPQDLSYLKYSSIISGEMDVFCTVQEGDTVEKISRTVANIVGTNFYEVKACIERDNPEVMNGLRVNTDLKFSTYLINWKKFLEIKEREIQGQGMQQMISWYGPNFYNKKRADGKNYNLDDIMVAHKYLPMGARVEITNILNGSTVQVPVRDRGPYHKGREFMKNRTFDASERVAKALDIQKDGTAPIEVKFLTLEKKESEIFELARETWKNGGVLNLFLSRNNLYIAEDTF